MKTLGIFMVVLALLLVAIPVSGQGTVLLFEDDFSNMDGGWEVADYDTGDVGYGDGYYYVTSEGGGSIMWGVAPETFDGAVMIEVDAVPVVGPSNNNNGYGVMCHVQDDSTSGYYLLISADGFASIIIAEGSEITRLYDWTETDAVILGNITNNVQAVCDNGLLQLYANGELVAEVVDDTYVNGGAALVAISYEDDILTEVHFDNFAVYGEGTSGTTGSGSGSKGSSSSGSSTTTTSAILFEDDFSIADNSWETGEFDSGDIGYGIGYYAVTSAGNSDIMWGTADVAFPGAVTIVVETTQVEAPPNNNNGYGVMCHVQEDLISGYLLLISGDGYAAIGIGDGENTTALVDWTPADSVNLGNTTNTLQAVCSDGLLQLYANGELVVETSDDTYMSGSIAMVAISYEAKSGTEIHFDNVVVSGDSAAPAPASSGSKN